MVGFGSSLRMARRTGWEGAYLDYETLKLLLSQIEAVYEEEGHWQFGNHHHHSHHRDMILVDGGGGGDSTEHHSRSKRGGGAGSRGGGGGGGHGTTRDYRDELFLESDSDVAFASSASDVLSPSLGSSGDEELLRRVLHHHHHQQHSHHLIPSTISPLMVVDPPGQSSSHKQFSLSYSHEASSTEEDEESGTCGVVVSNMMPISSWVRNSAEKSESFQKKMQAKKERMAASRRVDSDYFVRSAPDTFIINDDQHDDDDDDDDDEQGDDNNNQHEYDGFPPSAVKPPTSLLKAPRQRPGGGGMMNEHTALLGRQATTPPQSYYFGKESNIITPPRGNDGRGRMMGSSSFLPPPSAIPFSSTRQISGGVNGNNTATTTTNTNNNHGSGGSGGPPPKPAMSKWDAERKKQRRQRRLRRKKEMEKKVPRHIRVAHSKARAITERFLGLLRAEVEKCTLFAQARLGELADTAGSLRFPFFDDNNNQEYGSFGGGGGSSGNNAHVSRGAPTYEHPLSDGGMHPSASSSDEDGGYAGGQGLFPWSDSSEDDDSSNANKTSSIVTTGSGGGVLPMPSDAALHHAARDAKIKSLYSFGKHEGFDAAQRQIAHFEELRRNQPVFQRNDRIVGEDLLLISAVDEADGYTAVGAELLHVLRYICLNMIAVRKICRKHDRLLMNRMLGGYYHRKQATTRAGAVGVSTNTKRRNSGKELQMQAVKTLGGMLTQASGDVSYLDNHHKLEGVYDAKIQHLAISTTVEGIASCLALALAEYEVSRSRADAIANLKDNATPKRTGGSGARKYATQHPPQATSSTSFFGTPSVANNMDPRGTHLPQQTQRATTPDQTGESSLDGAPASTSSISIARLRFTVVSIYALREAVRVKLDPFYAYLARSLMAFSGHAVIGEGLEGCSRETLDFLVAYNPDAALLLDSAALYNGLKQGNWRRCPIGQVMVASLAAGATTPMSTAVQCYSVTTEQSVMQVLSVLPKPQQMNWSSMVLGCSSPSQTATPTDLEFDYIPLIVLQLQRVSVLLFSMNYFIAHATANTFVKAVGAQPAHSAAIIGITNVGAIAATFLHCYCMSRQPNLGNQLHLNLSFCRRMFLLAASMAVIGNVVCAVAIQRKSVPLVVLGRCLIGLGFAELVHRQLISKCLPAILVVSESACYIQFQLMGRILGILTGALADCVPSYIQGFGARSLQSSSWLMAFLWVIHGMRILVKYGNVVVDPKVSSTSLTSQELEHQLSKEDESSSDSSSDDGDAVVTSIMRSSTRISRDGPLASAASKPESDRGLDTTRKSASGTDLSALRIRIPDPIVRKRRHPLKTILTRVGKVLTYKVAIPVAMVIVVCTSFAQEVLFSSGAVVTDQYFNWSGAVTGVFMGGLMALFLPIDYICGLVSRRYEERTVIKRAISILCFGLVIMINWSSVTSLVGSALSKSWSQESRLYDWKVGIFQYTFGFVVSYGGIVALEGATLSLLSKVSLAASKNPLLNMATLVTLFTLFARTIGDVHILIVGLSDLIINTDIINSLVFPMLAFCLVASVLIRRHFFFMM